jgi:selenocysteine lyase/cysteine desulfurase
MKAHLAREIESSGYVAQEQQSQSLEGVYASLAQLLGAAGREEIALGASAVDTWAKAFYSIPLSPGDNLVTAYNEYCSNYVSFLQRARRDGVEIRVAQAGEDGALDLAHLESLVDARTKVIAVAHVPSSSGQVNPVVEIGRIARDRGVLYLLDACQGVGQLPVDVQEIGCDMLTGTSRKFLRGPRGIGFLYLRAGALARLGPVTLSNHAAAWVADNAYEMRSDAGVFEDWERSVTNQLGFGAAVRYLLDLGPPACFGRTQALAIRLRQGLGAIKGVTATCPPGSSAAIVTFNKAGMQAPEIKAAMAQHGINVQVASVVHTRLDLARRGIDTTVRVSPHYYNTEAELDLFLETLEGLG